MAEWLTVEEARDMWRDAPYDDDELNLYLDVAKLQVIEYGPASTAAAIQEDPTTVSDSYRLGQLMQARNLWNAAKMDPNANIGADQGFSFQPFPLDWTVKQLIRPKTGKPVIL